MGELEDSFRQGDYFPGGEKQGRCLPYHGYFRANAAHCTAACILMPMSVSILRIIRTTFHVVSRWSRETVDGQKVKTE
jgi:hypothetical protein